MCIRNIRHMLKDLQPHNVDKTFRPLLEQQQQQQQQAASVSMADGAPSTGDTDSGENPKLELQLSAAMRQMTESLYLTYSPAFKRLLVDFMTVQEHHKYACE